MALTPQRVNELERRVLARHDDVCERGDEKHSTREKQLIRREVGEPVLEDGVEVGRGHCLFERVGVLEVRAHRSLRKVPLEVAPAQASVSLDTVEKLDNVSTVLADCGSGVEGPTGEEPQLVLR